MPIQPEGIIAAAQREAEFHPKTAQGSVITAWDRRGKTLHKTVTEVNSLRFELDELKEQLKRRPF